MIKIELTQNKGYHWFSDGTVFVKGSARLDNGNILREADLLAYFNNTFSENEFVSKLNALNGLFSVVIKTENEILAAVDRVRNFPLLYHFDNNAFEIADYYKSIINKYAEIDPHSETAMRYIGWVPGRKTLLKDIFQIQAGEYLIFKNNKIETKFWFQTNPTIKNSLSKNDWKKEIRKEFFDIGKRLSAMIGNRPVVLPLSGGYDSRMIALLLKLNNHKNVTCFTFGDKTNKEAVISEKIAKKLNYPWVFIDYTPFTKTDFTQSQLFNDYVDFTANAISFPFLTFYFAIKELKEKYKIPSETIFIPGHSGDTIGGAHFFPDLKNIRSKKELAEKIFRIYCQLIRSNKKEKELLLQMLENNMDELRIECGLCAYDDWEIQEFQTKQLVNSANIFTFFGYEYLLPLSDKHYFNIFALLPLKYRAFKKLHNEVSKEIFSEYDILLEDEVSLSQRMRKYSYYKLRLKEVIPNFCNLSKLKKRTYTPSFYLSDQFLKLIDKELPKYEYKNGNALLSAWYIKHLTEQINNRNM